MRHPRKFDSAKARRAGSKGARTGQPHRLTLGPGALQGENSDSRGPKSARARLLLEKDYRPLIMRPRVRSPIWCATARNGLYGDWYTDTSGAMQHRPVFTLRVSLAHHLEQLGHSLHYASLGTVWTRIELGRLRVSPNVYYVPTVFPHCAVCLSISGSPVLPEHFTLGSVETFHGVGSVGDQVVRGGLPRTLLRAP